MDPSSLACGKTPCVCRHARGRTNRSCWHNQVAQLSAARKMIATPLRWLADCLCPFLCFCLCFLCRVQRSIRLALLIGVIVKSLAKNDTDRAALREGAHRRWCQNLSRNGSSQNGYGYICIYIYIYMEPSGLEVGNVGRCGVFEQPGRAIMSALAEPSEFERPFRAPQRSRTGSSGDFGGPSGAERA